MSDNSEKINSSFNGFDLRKDRKTGKTDYLTTGSSVIDINGERIVFEEQIDTNPHPPINEIHFQRSVRVSKVGKKPKKVKLKKISEINHEHIKF